MLQFNILAQSGRARAGVIHTPHGEVLTPSITFNQTPALDKKDFKPGDIMQEGGLAVLRNTFWMMEHDIADARQDIEWEGPIMADSGGFQMVSLSEKMRTGTDGVTFTFDGKERYLTPRMVVENAASRGVDMIMPLDYVVDVVGEPVWRYWMSAIMTARWFRLSRGVADDRLYYIVQGGLSPVARLYSLRDANRHLASGIPAVAVGGLAGREEREDMYRMIDLCTSRLPDNKPRHMLGVCKPVDLLRCIQLGMDTFDGIAATREGRHGRVWLKGGRHYDIKKPDYAADSRVLDSTCQCPVCTSGVTRAELHRGFRAKEREAITQLMAHNWYHNYHLVAGARQAILDNRLEEYVREYLAAGDMAEQ